MVLVQPYVYWDTPPRPTMPASHRTPYVAQRSRVSSGIEWSIKKDPKRKSKIVIVKLFSTSAFWTLNFLCNQYEIVHRCSFRYRCVWRRPNPCPVHYYFCIFFFFFSFFFLSIMHSSVWLATDKLWHQSCSALTRLRPMLIHCTHFSICVSSPILIMLWHKLLYLCMFAGVYNRSWSIWKVQNIQPVIIVPGIITSVFSVDDIFVTWAEAFLLK